MRVLVLGNYAPSLVRFRGPLLTAFVKQGHQVLACAPEIDPAIEKALNNIGVIYKAMPMNRTGMNPLEEFRSLVFLCRIILKWKPEAILAYTIKPILYGSIATFFTQGPRPDVLITGLGSTFLLKANGAFYLLEILIESVFRLIFKRCRTVIFFNKEDKILFLSKGFVFKEQRCYKVSGSGVDLVHFHPVPIPSFPFKFLMISRLLADKGIREYTNAARIIKQTFPDVIFQLLGPFDPNPSAIGKLELEGWVSDGIIQYLGVKEDVRQSLETAHVVVLPSYREGVPRALQEALAMAKPILTTDVPGCRDVVEDGLNGFLVPPRNHDQLADAMLKFITNPELLPLMGSHSRTLAEERFNDQIAAEEIVKALGWPS